jgi:hypothetical protein
MNIKGTEYHVEKIMKTYGSEPRAGQVSSYCYDNYRSITGLPTKERDEEGNFPNEVMAVFHWFEERFGHDLDEFTEAWG